MIQPECGVRRVRLPNVERVVIGFASISAVFSLSGKANSGLLLRMRQQVIERRSDTHHEIDLVGKDAAEECDQHLVNCV